MENINEFIEKLVKIDYMEEHGCYGHYPFQCFSKNKDGKVTMMALALGGDVEACYRKVRELVKAGAEKLFLSLDFPASGDIDEDFVCVFAVEDNKVSAKAITYNVETGEKIKTIDSSESLDNIVSQFEAYVYVEVHLF